MKHLLFGFVLVPLLAFAEAPSKATMEDFSLPGEGSYCGRLSEWTCIGQPINSMCAIDRQRSLYGHCFVYGSDDAPGPVECRCQ